MWGTVLGKPATPVRLALLALSLVKSWVKCHKQSCNRRRCVIILLYIVKV